MSLQKNVHLRSDTVVKYFHGGVKIIVTSDTVVKTSGREKNQPNFFGAKFLPSNFSPVKVREKDLLEILQSSWIYFAYFFKRNLEQLFSNVADCGIPNYEKLTIVTFLSCWWDPVDSIYLMVHTCIGTLKSISIWTNFKNK